MCTVLLVTARLKGNTYLDILRILLTPILEAMESVESFTQDSDKM